MLKRIIVLMCVLVVCLVCAVPAFAIGDASGQKPVYSDTVFDSLTITSGAYEGSIVSWPFNESTRTPGYVRYENEFDYEYFSAYVSGTGTSIYGSFTVHDANSFRIDSEYFYYYGRGETKATDFFIRPEEGYDVKINKCVLAYDVVWIKPNALGINYVTERERIQMELGPERLMADSGISLHYLIESTYCATTGHFLDGWALIGDFSLEVYYEYPASPSPSANFSVYSVADPLVVDYADKWVHRHYLSSTETEFDGFSWLANVVSGFFDFELFPGFSLNAIFNLVIVIGLVLWFIKLIS